MEANVVEAAVLAGSVTAPDLSMLGLFMRADIVVQAVMVGLLLASIWCWAIIFDKVVRLRKLNKLADGFEDKFWSGQSLDQLYDAQGNQPKDPMTAVFVTAMREVRRTQAKNKNSGDEMRTRLQDRVDRVMQITVGREMERVEKSMTFLASTGSTAPFIGLFGTVWGIMNAFTAIAQTKNTTLAVVAPGIAEALFATALGLVAAIPAVVAYNKLSRDLDRYAGRLDSFSGEFGAILSRQLDEKK
ncbi:membrane spanning protein in TolA-TolQ-TolR complex [Candidatus Terasakiella magnetica]|uniref:Tol-Pal system protein TolQ n=1 Tax=Candidatus Terasakiella magnetica TaxID=1867952 RepID=A0A1C3RHP5_9PROT|nr:protein TolQ [Candidatus Terasakiella magnetica]SCA56799.1 membrane spanning protein in TolA-TolQ-TolR complex [Candidatus Terasakiella magnetica]